MTAPTTPTAGSDGTDARETARAGPPHRGPSLLLLAAVHTALFLAAVVVLGLLADGGWPLPGAAAGDIRAFVVDNRDLVRVAGMLQFAAAVPLVLYAATASSRLRHLGVRAAGSTIALVGGIGAALTLAVAGLVLTTAGATAATAGPGTHAVLHRLAFVLGGPGHVPFLGLLLAGIAVTSLFARLLPRWLCAATLVIAVAGELATLALVVDALGALTAIARFGGFAALIAAGVLLPARRPARTS